MFLNKLSSLVPPLLSYLYSYWTSQDHFEMFFNCVRQRGGWNNPPAAQFRQAYGALLLHARVRAPNSASVTADLDRESLTVSRVRSTLLLMPETTKSVTIWPLFMVWARIPCQG